MPDALVNKYCIMIYHYVIDMVIWATGAIIVAIEYGVLMKAILRLLPLRIMPRREFVAW